VYNKIDKRHNRYVINGDGLVSDVFKDAFRIFGKKALEAIAAEGGKKIGEKVVSKISSSDSDNKSNERLKKEILNLNQKLYGSGLKKYS